VGKGGTFKSAWSREKSRQEIFHTGKGGERGGEKLQEITDWGAFKLRTQRIKYSTKREGKSPKREKGVYFPKSTCPLSFRDGEEQGAEEAVTDDAVYTRAII